MPNHVMNICAKFR